MMRLLAQSASSPAWAARHRGLRHLAGGAQPQGQHHLRHPRQRGSGGQGAQLEGRLGGPDDPLDGARIGAGHLDDEI
ncbi:MAG: hypothetical protein R3F43_25070 [bacterium]